MLAGWEVIIHCVGRGQVMMTLPACYGTPPHPPPHPKCTRYRGGKGCVMYGDDVGVGEDARRWTWVFWGDKVPSPSCIMLTKRT